MKNGETLPLIFDVRRFALDDGPGIRTTVFMKGCPLSCLWCHNPESMYSGREIAFYPKRCINCGECRSACPENAILMEGAERIRRGKCTTCGICVAECPSTALKIVGGKYSVEQLTEGLLSDIIFYETSRGGVTFSGGEPTLYMDYVAEVMRELKKKNIHIAVQTSGMFDLEEFGTKLLPHIDLIFYDIKLFDPREHKKYTGKTNEQILSNYTELAKETGNRIIPRVPLVPGITATNTNLARIADFLNKNGRAEFELLPYNPGGISKRIAIGKEVPAALPDNMLGIEEEKRLKRFFEAMV